MPNRRNFTLCMSGEEDKHPIVRFLVRICSNRSGLAWCFINCSWGCETGLSVAIFRDFGGFMLEGSLDGRDLRYGQLIILSA